MTSMLLETACDCISTYTASSSTSHFAAVVEKPISRLLVVRAYLLLQITYHHGWINLPSCAAKNEPTWPSASSLSLFIVDAPVSSRTLQIQWLRVSMLEPLRISKKSYYFCLLVDCHESQIPQWMHPKEFCNPPNFPFVPPWQFFGVLWSGSTNIRDIFVFFGYSWSPEWWTLWWRLCRSEFSLTQENKNMNKE